MTERLRFVILEHDHPFLHWDFMLEEGDVLAAWRLLSPPAVGDWIEAESLPSHRLMYLDYEGPVSRNRGVVQRVVHGTYSEISAPRPGRRILRLEETDLAQTATLKTEADTIEWRFQ